MHSIIRAVEHIGVKVNDIERSIAFYTNVLGFTLTGRDVTNGIALAFISAGNTVLELIAPPDGVGAMGEGQVAHIAFTVDDIDAAVATLREGGVVFASAEPEVHHDIMGGSQLIFFTGPDGEILELFQPSL